MPACLERKSTLAGTMHEYQCELLRLDPGFGVLKYIIDRPYNIAGTHLQPDDITYALYWSDRPYTLYVWPAGNRSSYYFNIADTISLFPGLFSWRDLAVDILIDAGGCVHVLDEDEVPPNLSPELVSKIQSAKELILKNWSAVIEEADSILRNLLRP